MDSKPTGGLWEIADRLEVFTAEVQEEQLANRRRWGATLASSLVRLLEEGPIQRARDERPSLWLETMNYFSRIRLVISGSIAAFRGVEHVGDIAIAGRREFRRRVSDALKLIRDHRLPAWETIRAHFTGIYEAYETVGGITLHPAVIWMTRRDAYRSPPFVAGILAFYACRCQLHRDFERNSPGEPVPKDVYAGPAARERCNRAERECIVALGGEVGGV